MSNRIHYTFDFDFCKESILEGDILFVKMRNSKNEWLIKQRIEHQKMAILIELKDKIDFERIKKVQFEQVIVDSIELIIPNLTWNTNELIDTIEYFRKNPQVAKGINVISTELSTKDYYISELIYQGSLGNSKYDINAPSFFEIFRTYLETCSSKERLKIMKEIDFMSQIKETPKGIIQTYSKLEKLCNLN